MNTVTNILKIVWSALSAAASVIVNIIWGVTVGITEGLIFMIAGFTKVGRRTTRNVTTGRAATRMMKGKGPL